MKKRKLKYKIKKTPRHITLTDEAINLEKYIMARRKFLKKLAWLIGFLSLLLIIIKYGW